MKLIIIFIIISVTTASQESSDDTRICEHYCATGFLRDDYYEKIGYRSFFDYMRKDEHECVKATDLGRGGVFSFIRNEPPASVAGYIEDIDPEEVGLECTKADINKFLGVEPEEDSCEGVIGYLQGVRPDGVGYEGTVDFLRGDKPEEVGYEGAVIYFRGLDQEGVFSESAERQNVEREKIYLETVNFHHCGDSEDSNRENVNNQCNGDPDIEIDEAIVFNPQNDVKENAANLPYHDELKGLNDEFNENYGFVEIEVYPKTKTRGISITLPADNFNDSYSHSEYLEKLVSKYLSNNDSFRVIPKILDLDACQEPYDPNCNDYSKEFKPKHVNIITFNDLNYQSDANYYDDYLQGDDPEAGFFKPIEYNIEDFEIKPVDFSEDLHKNFEPINVYFGGNEFVLYLKEDEKFYPKRENTAVVDFGDISNEKFESEQLPNDDPNLSSNSLVEPKVSSEKIQNDENKLSEQNLHNNKDELQIDLQDEKQQNASYEHQTNLNSPNTHTSENSDEDSNYQGDDPDTRDLQYYEIAQSDKHDIILILFDHSMSDNLRDSEQDVGDDDFLTKGGGLKDISSKDFLEQGDDTKALDNDGLIVNRSLNMNKGRKTRGLNVFFKRHKPQKRIFLIFIFSKSRQLIKR